MCALWGQFLILCQRVPGSRLAADVIGWGVAGERRLRGGFGFSVEPARDIDDPTRATSDGFAGARGSAAEGAAEERAGAAHDAQSWDRPES